VDRSRWIKVIVFFALVLVMDRTPYIEAATKHVVVGNKNFTEQYIIGQLIKQVLEDRGFKVELKSDLTSMALRAGMESGDIDICADYTGTAWMVHLKHAYKPGTGHAELYKLVKSEDEKKGFVWLYPIWNNNTYALASWSEFAGKHNLETLSELAELYQKKAGKIITFVNFEFSVRPDGLPSLQDFYNFVVAKDSLKTGTPGASLIALKAHQTQVAMVFGTDASIAKYGWHVYSDDRSFFPPYDLTPYVRKQVLDGHPEIAHALNELVDTFPGGGQEPTPQVVSECQKTWQVLNSRVDIHMMEPEEVALEYLVRHRLVEK